MTLTYWSNYSKKKNSTAQPTSGTDVTIVLKDDCSIINPVIRSATMPASANYCYISEWGRYYFVTNCVYISNTIKEFTLEVDVLASYKSAIGSTVAHIAYSSTGYDTDIIDARLPVKITKSIIPHDFTPTIFDTTGCYILTVANTRGGINGFCTSYVCTEATVKLCANALMSLDIDARLIKSIYSPFDAIISCIWLPLNCSTVQTSYCTSAEAVIFGDFACDGHEITPGVWAPSIAAFPLATPYFTDIGLITAFTPTYTDFRKVSPYTSYSLYIPYYGLIELNASDVQNVVDNLNVCYSIDICTGDMTVGINSAAIPGWCQTITTNIGVNCPIAQTSTNTTGTLSSIAGTAGGIGGAVVSGISGNVPGAVISGMGALFSAANTALSYCQRGVSTKGGVNGRSMIPLGDTFVLMEYAQDTEDPDDVNYIAKWGRPVGLTEAISNHSGYVQCDQASVSCSGTAIEKDRINSYLNTGFYYE